MGDFERRLAEELPRGAPGREGGLVEASWLDPAQLHTSDWHYRNAAGAMAGFLLGYYDGQPIGRIDDRHGLLIAGSRAGKGISFIVPNMLKHDGSVLATDPKGELARITARARRAKGQKVFILDPFNATQLGTTNSYNPLAELDLASATIKDDVAQIAEALIIGNDHDPHWTDSARILVNITILYTLTLDPEDRDLITVWELLSGTHAAVKGMAKRAECGPRKALFLLFQGAGEAFEGSIAAAGENYDKDMNDKEFGSIFSSALTQLKFLDSKPMQRVLRRHDFKLADLKADKVTVYLCLPSTYMGSHMRWLRVIINLSLVAFERSRAKPDIPVLLMLDEFPVLGTMKSLETAAGLMAGYRVKLMAVVQDLSQLQRLYARSWETFVGNAGVLLFWGNSDKTTLDYMSDKLGQTTVRLQQPTGATSGQRLAGASGTREEARVQRLAAPHELELLLDRRKRRVLVKVAGELPVILQRPIYYQDQAFAGEFDPAD